MKSSFSFFIPLLIVLVGLFCYSNTLHNPFVFDDIANIVELESTHLDSISLEKLSKLLRRSLKRHRPVVRLSLGLNYYWGKLDPFGYHLVNLVIHLINAVLVFLFIKLTLNLPSLQKQFGKHARETAFLCGLLFVSHPTQIQAVSYITQRMASLAALFFLLTFYCFAKARLTKGAKQTSYYAASALAMMLAFGSKQNTITLPLFLALYEYCFWQQLKSWKTRRKFLYVVAGLIILLSFLAMVYTFFDPVHFLNRMYHKKYSFTLDQRMLTELRVVIFYLGLLFAPLSSLLMLDYHFPLSYSFFNPVSTIIGLALVFGLIGSSIYLVKKRPLISFSLIWFWGNLVVESSFWPLDLVNVYRLYLPSVGGFLLISILSVRGIEKLIPQERLRQSIKTAGMVFVIAFLSFSTYQRNKVWQNRVALWEDSADKSPAKPGTQFSLGKAYQVRGRMKEAIAQYRRTLELNPKFTGAHNNLGFIYMKQGKTEEARLEFMEELKLDPESNLAYQNLILAIAKQGRVEELIALCEITLKKNPKRKKAYYSLGMAYQELGRPMEAIAQYRRTLKLDPDFKGAHNKLGTVYLSQNKPDLAAREFLEEIKLYPDNPKAYYNLAYIYAGQKRLAEAAAQYRRVLEIDPGFRDAHNQLGIIYVWQGKTEQARLEFLLEIKHNPDNDKPHKNLGLFHLKTGNRDKALFHFEKSLALNPQQPQADKIRQIIKQQRLSSPNNSGES